MEEPCLPPLPCIRRLPVPGSDAPGFSRDYISDADDEPEFNILQAEHLKKVQWAAPMSTLQERIMEDSRRREKKGSCSGSSSSAPLTGLLAEMQAVERIARDTATPRRWPARAGRWWSVSRRWSGRCAPSSTAEHSARSSGPLAPSTKVGGKCLGARSRGAGEGRGKRRGRGRREHE